VQRSGYGRTVREKVKCVHAWVRGEIAHYPEGTRPTNVVGRIAQEAGVGRLIVSHIGQFDLEPALAELKKAYAGPLTVGADLQCTPVL
jgi:hypothetical protein